MNDCSPRRTFLVLVLFTVIVMATVLLMKSTHVIPQPNLDDCKEVMPTVVKIGPEDCISFDKLLDGPLRQDDNQLVQHIRSHYLTPPSKEEYNIETEKKDTSMGQAAAVNEILKEMKNGFFVECGALDGETRSNTYLFERQLGWQGLLIEGDPKNFEKLIKKHRKAYSVNACLSTKDYPIKATYKQAFNVGKIVSTNDTRIIKGYKRVQCLPFYSILLALNQTTIDYFSLDVEGAELDVLKTIPLDKLNIRVMSVEFVHSPGGTEAIKTYVEKFGYYIHSKVTRDDFLANDLIFVKNGTLTDL